MTSERVLNDEMYAWKADARHYLDGETMVTGDWSLTFASRVVWLIGEMARQVAENKGLRRELERACEDPDAAVREENERLREQANDVADMLGESRRETEKLREGLEAAVHCEFEDEVLRLRDALKRIAYPPQDKPGPLRETLTAPYEDARVIARAALADQPSEEKE